MIYWCERSQHFCITRLVSHVAYFAREVGVVGFLDCGVDVVLGGRDDGYVRPVFEEGKGGAIANTRILLDARGWNLGLVDVVLIPGRSSYNDNFLAGEFIF